MLVLVFEKGEEHAESETKQYEICISGLLVNGYICYIL